MINLLIVTGAVLVALRMTAPLLRIVIMLVAKIAAFTLVLALAIILIVALLTHGTFI